MHRFIRSFIFILLFSAVIFAGVGDPAPDFTLNKLGGGSVTLSDFRGKVVYIFWFGYN